MPSIASFSFDEAEGKRGIYEGTSVRKSSKGNTSDPTKFSIEDIELKKHSNNHQSGRVLRGKLHFNS